MSELIYIMDCPKCGPGRTFMFAGSGTKGDCMHCGYELPRKKRFNEFLGTVISYNG